MSERKILTILLVLSVIARLVSAVYLGNTVTELPGTQDQISYHTLSQRVLDGYGFTFDKAWWPITAAGAPTSHWSFLYTLYLVMVYGLVGVVPLAARILQAVIVGLLHPYLAYSIGKRLFTPQAGLVAAALTTGYAYFVYYGGALMTEPFYITAILASLYLAILISDEPRQWSHAIAGKLVLLGLALGAAILLRQLYLLFVPFLLLWMVWRMRETGIVQAVLRLALPLVVVAALILPITYTNYVRFHSFVLLNTNAGYAFFWGNHPAYGTHFYGILPPELGYYEALIPAELTHLDEAALDKALLQRGMQFIIDDPGRYILLSLSRIPVYFQFWPSRDSGMISNISRVASFGILWPLMLYGLVRMILDKHARRFDQPAWLLLLFCAVYTGIHLLSWTLIRYRLPVDAVLLVFGGYAIVDLYKRVRAIRRPAAPTGEPLQKANAA